VRKSANRVASFFGFCVIFITLSAPMKYEQPFRPLVTSQLAKSGFNLRFLLQHKEKMKNIDLIALKKYITSTFIVKKSRQPVSCPKNLTRTLPLA